jgi:uncharacterized protein (DUF1330 family)
MAKGYVIFVDEKISDAKALDEYVQKAVPTVLAAGGAPIVFGPPEDVLEGEWRGIQTVILEFPSVEAARGWYESAGYQALIGERQAASEGNAILIGGFEMPTA